MEGKRLIVQVLKPALQGLDSAEIIDISFSSIGDLLLSFSAVACPQSGAAWTKTAMRETCRKAGSGSGFQSRESAFGNVSVCGQQYKEQPPVFSEPAKAALLNVQGDKARHVVLVTWKMGSAMPAAKFVEIVRNKLGVGTKVSIAYPKTRSQCVSKKIIPPDNDTSWSDFHPMSLSGGQVFEEIASSTGGRTHDLCNESDFSQTGKTND
jgi:hypothetical protein